MAFQIILFFAYCSDHSFIHHRNALIPLSVATGSHHPYSAACYPVITPITILFLHRFQDNGKANKEIVSTLEEEGKEHRGGGKGSKGRGVFDAGLPAVSGREKGDWSEVG